MATSHGSPPMERNSKLDCKCLEKGGPIGGSHGADPPNKESRKKESKNQARGNTLQARQNGRQ